VEDKMREHKRNIYIILVAVSVIVFFGSFGAIDTGIISVKQGVWQIVISLLSCIWFGNLLRIETNRIASFD